MCLDLRVEGRVGVDVSSHSPMRQLSHLFTGGSDGESQPDGT